MGEHVCPDHSSILLTPKDETCHNHASDTQQAFHNLHCRTLKCPRALPGTLRHCDVPTVKPRNGFEKFLLLLDSL